jgi:hypothetical protein
MYAAPMTPTTPMTATITAVVPPPDSEFAIRPLLASWAAKGRIRLLA